MKVWFYYAKAGGGHKAPALALAETIKKLYPEVEVKNIDLAYKALFLFRSALDTGYVFMTHHLSWVYAILFTISKWRPVIKLEYWLAEICAKSSLKSQLVVESPDAIVATHFLVSPLRAALKELKRNIPIIVVVTDPFSVSPAWFLYRDLRYIVYSEEARLTAIAAGVASENVVVLQQVANHPILSLNSEKKEEVKSRWGIAPKKKTILIIGGGNGLPNGVAILNALLRDKIDAEIAVVCGTNEEQLADMKAVAGNYSKKVLIFGWVKNLTELIAISDLVITKAGAGVVWETLLHRKLLLITYYIFGQEKGTVNFVVNNKLGVYESDPRKAVKKANELLYGDKSLEMLNNFSSLNLAPGNDEVANYIYRYISEFKP